MIVDDEFLTREFLKINISKIDSRWEAGCEAIDGKEALEKLNVNPVDLIITDIKMPIMDGIELCKGVSMLKEKPKLVILSGYEEFEFAKKAIKYGVTEYLLKPLVTEELQKTLENITRELDTKTDKTYAINSIIKYSDALSTSNNKALPMNELIKLLEELVKAFDEGSKINKENNDIVSKVKDYISMNFSKQLSLSDIAEKMNISDCYLSNVFHKSVGESYIKFLTRIRMEQAARLLRKDTFTKISTIAEQVGYLSAKHFISIFKNYYYMTPGEYREKYIHKN